MLLDDFGSRENLFSKTFISKSLGHFFFLILSLFVAAANAQTPDSSQYHLPALTIRDARFERTGYTFWKADSLPLNGTISLSDRLLWENTIDLRANAPGTLATISVRGAGPNRTPVFWNGLNLQSPMNGVVDVSLLPLWPDDKLEIQYGGQSAAQSSGAMGGSVVIVPGHQQFDTGFSGYGSAAIGSFGRWEGSAGAGFSNKKFASKVRATWQQADNTFKFQKQGLDGKFYNTRQVNNFLERTDLQQFNQLKINEKNILKTAFWFQNAFREIPPSTTEAPRDTWQRDRSHRAVATWEHAPNAHSLWITRAAWLNDFLSFYLAGDTDTSRSRQVLFSTERAASLGKKWSLRTGGTALRQWAQVDGYTDSTRWFGQSRVAGYAMTEWKQEDTRFSALIRQEWAEAQAAPLTWSVAGQIGLGRGGEAKFHISRNFNLPTLNDRFWKNLGRPDLRPEKGYSTDISWVFRRPDYSVELTGFQLILDDWILWQPDSTGLFMPGNLRKVWSRGVEISGSWQVYPPKPERRRGGAGGTVSRQNLSRSRFKVDLSGRLQFSKTTNVAVYGDSESVLGEQLPFTPRVSGGLSLRASRGVFSAAYLQQFTGERLDNGRKEIEAFGLGNLLASCALFDRRLTIDFRLENLWNTQYEIIRYRPMPGSSWKLGVGFTW
ncbi:MAG: TonB-dependent receptor [Lewinellaceae bacterium]|nr:TonB-dependent receptor [Lewinellaceae bacterium]